MEEEKIVVFKDPECKSNKFYILILFLLILIGLQQSVILKLQDQISKIKNYVGMEI